MRAAILPPHSACPLSHRGIGGSGAAIRREGKRPRAPGASRHGGLLAREPEAARWRHGLAGVDGPTPRTLRHARGEANALTRPAATPCLVITPAIGPSWAT
jgi:hypothetical protein